MNSSFTQADCGSEKDGARWYWMIFALLVCFAAISPESLWNDEALTAMKAMQSSLGAWWQAMLADKASDLQMPLYMIYMWGFAQIFGVSELALRAANIPFFAGGVVAFMAALPGAKKKSMALVALISPFAWYYLSEARPYAMQLGASLMITAALCFLCSAKNLPVARERKWVALFCFGLILLSGSSLLGMIWAGAAFLVLPALWSWKRLAELARAHLVILISTFCLLVGLGIYYLWTLKLGARASDVGRTDARNVLFIIYELLGFGGLGPGRLEIRDGGFRVFAPYTTPLVIYAVLLGDLLIVGLGRMRRGEIRVKLPLVALCVALPAAVIIAAGYAKEFRVLGRHFMPLLPVVWLVVGLGLKERWLRHGWISRPIACGFLILSMVSCLSFRFAARHERDDYRDAAEYANRFLRGGHTVWWNAGKEGAVYYSIPVVDSPDKNAHALWLMNPTGEVLRSLSPPDLIIISKPDVYDGRGAVAQFLAQGGYSKVATFPALAIWQRGGRP